MGILLHIKVPEGLGRLLKRLRFSILFQHQTSILLLGIFSLLATFFELSQAVPIPADPYHEEKLGRVKIQVYRGPDQKYKPTGYGHDPHHDPYHDTYAAHGFFVKQPLNL